MISLCNYLEDEVPIMSERDFVGLGERRTNCSFRALMIKEFERIQAETLDKALKEQRDQRSRIVLARRHTDKISSSFLLLRPGPRTRNDNSYFSKHHLTLFEVPSVICRGKVGQRIGYMKLDKWGDSMFNATVHGEPLYGHT